MNDNLKVFLGVLGEAVLALLLLVAVFPGGGMSGMGPMMGGGMAIGMFGALFMLLFWVLVVALLVWLVVWVIRRTQRR